MMMDGRLRILLLFFIGATTLTACCTKKDCDGMLGLSDFELSGFTLAEVDTVELVRYEENSSFSRVLDTLREATDFRGGDTALREYEMYLSLPAGADYRITFPGTGRTFAISGILLEERPCNRCLFILGSDFRPVLASYVLDGAVMDSWRARLAR